MPQQLKYKQARFIGDKKNLKQEIGIIDGFPFATYLDDGIPVLFADSEYKDALLNECKDYGIEVFDASVEL